uniref:Uncharacterized protein n=1 Tax=Avena sativa TaxID=4498 RepID=A0ACD5WN88_AVESA
MDASAGSSPPPHSQENPPKHGGGRGKAPVGEIRKGEAATADDFMFAEDTFPSLPDFPCLSSPSSSTFSSSSSSNSSSTLAAAGRGRGRCRGGAPEGALGEPSDPAAAGDDDVLDDIDELLNFATLSDSMPWEDEPLFPDDVGMMIEDAISHQPPATGHRGARNAASSEAAAGGGGQDSSSAADDLARFFMEWLTNNRDCISAEDLRSIRLRRSTIEAAAARLGGGRQGTMQLLKLILTWVQNHHLQKKRARVDDELPSPGANPGYEFPGGSAAPATSWPMPYQQAYGREAIYPNAAATGQYPFQQGGSTSSVVVSSQPFSPPAPVADMQAANMPWPQQYPAFPGAAPYPMPPPQPLAAAGFGVCPQPLAGVEPSASKEARKKRMARQRRLSCLQHQRSQQLNLGQIQNAMIHPQQEVPFSPRSAHSVPVSPPSPGGWCGLWPPPSVQVQGQGQPMVPNPLSTKPNSSSRQKAQKPSPDAGARPPSSGAQQGTKPAADKNLRFLLQKVLKQSDVGALGRIVLPKKEAETHLPELKTRDGISIPMEDIGTSRVWSMRYRFWPNNKSRMYLLENTGDFVRSNELQEGDFIVIYSDVKSGKYLIRGVKVRPPQDLAKQKHGSLEKGSTSDAMACAEDGGGAEAGGCKGKSPHGVRRSRQEAASMNQMTVSI